MMKKYAFILTLVAILFTTNNISAQGLENFNNSNASASYSNGNFVGNGGITWNYVASRDENNDSNGAGIDGKALMLRRSSSNSAVFAENIPNGIANFSVTLYKGFTGAGNRQVELFINDVSKGTSIAFDDPDDMDMYTFTVNDINVEGDFKLEIRNITSKQVIVDDITWTEYSPVLSNESFDKLNVNVYPNPVKDGKLFLQSSSTDVKDVKIYNILGRKVVDTKVNAREEINVSNLSSGMYILSITENDKTLTKKIIIE